MAKALLNQIAGDDYEVKSAGLEPGSSNPLALKVLREIGIDIGQKDMQTSSTFSNPASIFHLSLRFAMKRPPKDVVFFRV
jgi:protein-tyrosine-phosphatase